MNATKFKQWVFDIMTVWGFALTALGTYLTYKSGSVESLKENPVVTIVIILVFILLILSYHFYHKSSLLVSVLRGRDYTDEAKNMILELNRNPKNNHHVEKCIESLTDICQEISYAFRKYHDSDVAVCIHYINVDNSNQYYLNVLCRNTETKKRLKKFAPPAYKIDYISENTDFESLLKKIKTHPISKLFYINNFLPFSPHYRNSHFSAINKKRYYQHFGFVYRIFKWELPYKSTIVVPLITSISSSERKLNGFLSIDSPRIYAFSTRYDVPVLLSLANAIAPIVEIYNNKNLLHTS